MDDTHGLQPERLVWMFTQMLRIREFEERVKRSFTELPGLLRGHTHLADGAEASIVGSLTALRPGDQILTTYRCHGYPLVLGTDPRAVMAEIFGKQAGLCGGYGGSMHLTDVARGFLGTSGIVGQGIPQATGAAYAAQIAGKNRSTWCRSAAPTSSARAPTSPSWPPAGWWAARWPPPSSSPARG
jgi:TPP-dependent pyruvate/acetoin dehydrogenase alpha subunit